MINMPKITPVSMPPTALHPMEWLPSADAPFVNIRGSMPTTKANDVISMGRSLSLAPSSAASTSPLPARLRCTANSTIRMASLRQQSYQHDQSYLHIYVILQPRKADKANTPRMPVGTVSITRQGQDIISYCAASRKNTNNTLNKNTNTVWLPALISSLVMPVNS